MKIYQIDLFKKITDLFFKMSQMILYSPEDGQVEILPLKEGQIGYLCDMNSLKKACQEGHLPVVKCMMKHDLNFDWYAAASTALFYDQLLVWKFIFSQQKFSLTDRNGKFFHNVSSLEAAEYLYELLFLSLGDDERLTEYVRNMCQNALLKSRLDVLEYFWEKGYRQYHYPYSSGIAGKKLFSDMISMEQVREVIQWIREKKIPPEHSDISRLDNYRKSFPEYEDIIQEIFDSMSQDEFERKVLQECQKMYGIQLL